MSKNLAFEDPSSEKLHDVTDINGQFGQSNIHRKFDFFPRPARNNFNVQQLKGSLLLLTAVINILCLQGRCAGTYIQEPDLFNGKAHWKQQTAHKDKFYIWYNPHWRNWKMSEMQHKGTNSSTFTTAEGKSEAPPNEEKWKIYKDGKWQVTEHVQVSSGN